MDLVFAFLVAPLIVAGVSGFLILIFNALGLKDKEDQNVYKYQYQRYPFDNQQIFTIHANSQEEANELAIKEMQRLFDTKVTIMTHCYPV